MNLIESDPDVRCGQRIDVSKEESLHIHDLELTSV